MSTSKLEKKKENGDYKKTQWSLKNEDLFVACGPTVKELPSGVYTICRTLDGDVWFNKTPMHSDVLFEFKDSVLDSIIKEVENFWSKKEVYNTYGLLHKRGYLFYGPPGCGKSGLVSLIIQKVIKRNGIVLLCGWPPILLQGLKILRETEPERHIVCVFEDIDSIIKNHGEADILSILDGEEQIDNVLNIATTNYPEDLDKRIVARPRRFDKRFLINLPNKLIRKEFFINKLHLNKNNTKINTWVDDIDSWVDATEGFSFAAMTELVIQIKCLGISFGDAIENLHSLITKKISSNDFNTKNEKIGFTS